MKRWMKHLLCMWAVLVALAMVLPGYIGSVKAAEQTGKAGENVYWSFQEDTGTLTIYGEGEMADYSGIVGYYPPWEEFDGQIKQIVVEEGITAIGSEAFCHCFNATCVTLPSTLKTIEDGAFLYCESLQTITIPENATNIGGGMVSSVFGGCISMEKILVSEENPAYTSVNGILYNKSKTELILCPEAFTGACAVPEGTVKIEEGAFGFCTGLTEICIPGSVKEIGEYAFLGCTALTRADLSALTCEFFPYIFDGCTALNRITLPENYPYYKQDAQGALYAPDMSRLIFCPRGYTGSFSVPYGVKSIEDHAFDGCVNLKSAVLSETVERIGCNAFRECTALTRVTIPNGVKVIEGNAFELCTSLESVKIPGSVETIEGGAFRICTSLRSISLEYGLKVIGYCAFEGCESLTEVAIPDSLTVLDEKAFENCTSLSSVILPGDGLEECGINIFLGCVNIRNVYFRGKAPSAQELEESYYALDPGKATLYYVEGQPGWASPTMNGFITATWSGKVATDVVQTDYFYTPVHWAMETGITTGVGKDMFRPENSCTRGQIVTFLWRAAGCPEPETGGTPFTDVSVGDYYNEAVLWAVEQGITNGVGHGRFSPEGTCTRGQVATFLWRANGQPAPTISANTFTDVAVDAYYAQAVLWASEHGITNGVGTGRFNPEGLCTRGQIVTFLWRAVGEPALSTDLSLYCPVLTEKMERPNYDTDSYEGMLCDLDGDGMQELFLTYYYGDGIFCDVYTIRDGEVVTLMMGEKIQTFTEGVYAWVGVAEVEGKLYFYTYDYDYEHLIRGDYENVQRMVSTWKLYSMVNGELTPVTEAVWDCVGFYNPETGWWVTLPESFATMNGVEITLDAYNQWDQTIDQIRSIDGETVSHGDCMGYTMETLLEICG